MSMLENKWGYILQAALNKICQYGEKKVKTYLISFNLATGNGVWLLENSGRISDKI